MHDNAVQLLERGAAIASKLCSHSGDKSPRHKSTGSSRLGRGI